MELDKLKMELNNLKCHKYMNCYKCINNKKCDILLYVHIDKIINNKY